MPKVTIDGRTVEVTAGATIMEAARAAGVEIPHLCWHPSLSPSASCGLCAVEAGTPGVTVRACETVVRDGMEIQSDGERPAAARRAAMELLLLNHPLDCPVCDQAGECALQRSSFLHGAARGRFAEEKVAKPKGVALSDRITFDAERCILCTRCLRYLEEVRGLRPLGLVGQGVATQLALAEGEELADPYQGNLVDLCPVGAMTATDFRLRSRVWFLETSDSLCPGCATGCNVRLSTRDDRILRAVPRENPAVNGPWMCDLGRDLCRKVQAPTRLDRPWLRVAGELEEVDWREALDRVAELLLGAAAPVTFVASTRAANEDLWLLRRLAGRVPGSRLAVVTPRGEPDGFLLQADRSPNAAGAARLGWPAEVPAESGGGLVVLGDELVDYALQEERDFLVVLGWSLRELAAVADVVLPLAGFAEVDQTYVNHAGRLQAAPAVVPPPDEALATHVVIPALERRLADGVRIDRSPDEVFRSMVATVPAFGRVEACRIRRLAPLGLDLSEGTEV